MAVDAKRGKVFAVQTEVMLPDLQSCVLCEDVRCEFNGMQTLVGVLNIVPTPKLPVTYMRLCIWTLKNRRP